MSFACLFALQLLGNGVCLMVAHHSIERFGVVGALTTMELALPALVALEGVIRA